VELFVDVALRYGPSARYLEAGLCAG